VVWGKPQKILISEIMKKSNLLKTITVATLVVFALATIFVSSSVLFDWFDIRTKQGNYVPFIVKTNLTAGVIYLISVYGYITSKKWAFWSMITAALILIYAFALLYMHIHTGGLYEKHTIGVMIFRIVLTLIFAALIYWNSNNEK